MNLFWVLVAVLFVAGLASPWLLAWTIGPSLPGYFVERLANFYVQIGFNTAGDKLLRLTEDGIYVVDSVDPDELDTQPDHWTYFNGARFAVGWDRTEDAFGTYVRDIDVQEAAAGDIPGTQTKKAADIVRGGYDTFVDASKRARDADFHVLAGEFLARFEGLGGARETAEAESAAMYDYAGDTNQHSAKVRWGGAVTFFILSSLLTLVLF